MRVSSFRESDRAQVQARARELEPSAIAVYLATAARRNERCQIRVTNIEFDDDGTQREFVAIYGSGATWVEALEMFAKKMGEIAAAEKEGNELQMKLRERGLA